MRTITLVFDARYLRALREQTGLSAAQVAFATGLDPDGLEAAEDPNRKTMVNRRVLETLAAFYGAKERNLYHVVKGRNAGDRPNSRAARTEAR